MALDPLVGEIEVSSDGHPLKRLAGKVFPDVFIVCAPIFVGRGCFSGRIFLVLFGGGGCGDDDIVLAVELIGSGRVFLVDEVLLL